MPSPTELPEVAIDTGRCPLCGADNRCAMTPAPIDAQDAGPGDCWCMVTSLAPGVLDRLPPALRGQACICARCARG